jgi:hypothetical protein
VPIAALFTEENRVAEIRSEYERDAEILAAIRDLREAFENNFDRTWFSVILEGLPMGYGTLREIRDLVALRTLYPGDEKEVYAGVLLMEGFIANAKRFLLPVIRERLGVSYLHPGKMVRDRRQLVFRCFVAYTFPYNLERLQEYTERLKALLLFHYPFLG